MCRGFTKAKLISYLLQCHSTIFVDKNLKVCLQSRGHCLSRPSWWCLSCPPYTVKPSHYENMPIQIYRSISPPKTENFQIKILIFFIFLLKSIDCGYSLELPRWGSSNKYPQSMLLRRGGSNEYPQPMLLSRNKKNNVYPCKPQFYYIKVGFKGVKVT